MRTRRIAWAVWLAAVCSLYFFENNLGTRIILFASLLVPLASLGCAWLASRDLDAALKAPDQAGVHEPVACECVVTESQWSFGCAVQCVVQSRNQLTGETSVLHVPCDGGSFTRFTLTSEHCGCVVLTLIRVELQDWFSLWRILKPVGAAASVTISPTLFPVLATCDDQHGSMGEDVSGGVRQANEPGDSEIRAYVPGDAIRQIHWKLSEKTGQVLVRSSPEESRSGILLLLETAAPDEGDVEAMDMTARGLLSTSFALTEQGVPHGVGWYDDRHGALNWQDVRNGEALRHMSEDLLSTASRHDADSVAFLFRKEYPQAHFRRVVIFAPHPGVDVLPLADQPLTVVLPSFVPYESPDSDIQVVSFSGENAMISL